MSEVDLVISTEELRLACLREAVRVVTAFKHINSDDAMTVVSLAEQFFEFIYGKHVALNSD